MKQNGMEEVASSDVGPNPDQSGRDLSQVSHVINTILLKRSVQALKCSALCVL